MKPILYPLSILKQIRDNFVDELNQAYQGKKTSLAFFKNPLPQKPLIKEGEIFQVMVIGGSIIKSALIKNDKIVSLIEEKIPKIITKEFFFSLFEKYLDDKVKVISINFAFPLQPLLRNNLLDGKLTSATKEHKLVGLINRFIGVELEKYIKKPRIRVSVANDTICLLLSNKADVAGVVGTGTNFAFFLDKNTAVNLESSNFNQFPQTETGKNIDKKSSNPDQQLFEKEVSGAYLYQHYNYSILDGKAKIPVLNDLGSPAKREGPTGVKNTVLSFHLNSTTELNQLAKKGDSLAQKLFERSASLIACQIAGIYEFKRQTVDDGRWMIDVEDRRLKIENPPSTLYPQPLFSTFYPLPSKLTFLMEGSLFWQGYHYQDYVKKYLKLLTVRENAISFIKINNSDIIGAAQLVIGVKK